MLMREYQSAPMDSGFKLLVIYPFITRWPCFHRGYGNAVKSMRTEEEGFSMRRLLFLVTDYGLCVYIGHISWLVRAGRPAFVYPP